MEELRKPPFFSVGQAIAFYNHQNPARQRFINLAEPEGASTPEPDFSGYSPRDIWAAVAKAIQRSLAYYNSEAQHAWRLYYTTDRNTKISIDDIAKAKRRSRSTIYKWFEEINEDLEKEFQRRELVLPPTGRQD